MRIEKAVSVGLLLALMERHFNTYVESGDCDEGEHFQYLLF
jgi:hypothetical protein